MPIYIYIPIFYIFVISLLPYPIPAFMEKDQHKENGNTGAS